MSHATSTASRPWQLARPLRCLGIAALALWLLGAQAQNVQPPAVRGLAFQGQALQSLNTATHLECQAKCQAAAGCSGYTFVRESKAASCRLIKGGLGDIRQPEAVSCRMPCTAPGAASTAPNATPPALLKATAPGPLPPQMSGVPHAVGKGPLPPAPPPSPMPPAPSPQAKKATDPAKTNTATPVTRSSLSGLEMVVGSTVSVPSLSTAQATAQCPGNKIALSAAYVAEPTAGDATFGLEIRGAWPEGNAVRVAFRNANVAVAAQVRATVVCVDPIEGLRRNEQQSKLMYQSTNASEYLFPGCAETERLVGGGAMGTAHVNLSNNGMEVSSRTGQPLASWSAHAVLATPLARDEQLKAVALCAPENKVDGWEVRSAPLSVLGGRSRTNVQVTCSAGKRPLAAGFYSQGGVFESANFISPVLQFGPDIVSAQLLNRNTLGGPESLQSTLTAVCAPSR